jgi:hypothetical protein
MRVRQSGRTDRTASREVIMIDDAQLKELYTHEGPFATAYLDASRNTERGEQEVELRWRALRGELADAGAEEDVLAAMDEAVQADHGTAGRHGLVLVGGAGRVRYQGHLPEPPQRELAAVTPLPYLAPFLAQRGEQPSYVLVTADRTGADIEVSDRPDASTTVQGHVQHPIHRTGRDEWDESHFQHRVENAWGENAKDVADVVTTYVRKGAAKLVLLAGDERARALLHTDLAGQLPPGTEVVELQHGGRGVGASKEALQDSAQDAMLRQRWRERRTLLEHLQQNLGRQEYAAAGVAAVVDALRRSAADTVVISDDPSSTLKAWIGPEIAHIGLDQQELADLGVEHPQQDRLDSALIRSAVGTGAHLVFTPNAHEYVPEGIAALLRY